MPQQIKATPGSVPWAAVYFNLGNWIVTSQPAYNEPLATQNPYAAIAAAGINSVLSVRDPSEATTPVNPFDLTEAQQCVVNGVSHTNISFPHVPMPQAQYQPLFNVQAYNAATVIHSATSGYPWRTPILIHCSSGDRASAAFAVFLIAYYGYTNAQAVAVRDAKPRARGVYAVRAELQQAVTPAGRRARQRQHVVARQRREVDVRRRDGVDPDDLVDLGAGRDRAGDIHPVDRGIDAAVRLVRGDAFECAERGKRLGHHAATEFLVQLARERRHIVFARIALAAGLHESGGAALAHQQHASLLVANERRHDADWRAHASSS